MVQGQNLKRGVASQARLGVLWMAALLSGVMAWSAAASTGMTLEQIASVSQVGQVVVSPDGQHIAYSRVVPRRPGHDPDGGAWVELHIIDAQGQSRPFITGEVRISQIAWMPDSSAVTYVSRRDGDSQTTVYRIPVAGGESERLATIGTGVASYDVSPDGRHLALIGTEADEEALVSERNKGFTQIVFEEDWKPRRLWIKPIGGEAELVELDGSVQQAHWSPAGDRLAVAVTPRQLVDDTLMFQRVRIISTDGTELGRVDNPGKLGPMAWSPDGRHLALIATASVHDTREGRLLMVGAEGGEWTKLLPGLEGHIWHVDWAGADRLAFISYEGVEARLATIAPDGSNEQTVMLESGLIFESLSVADTGRMVTRVSTPTHPSEVYALDGGEARRLTDSNPWLAEVPMARQELLRYDAADGLMIEGLVIWPLDYQEGRRYPLIVAAHGGPEAHYSNGWLTSYNLPAQHAAAEGYFMFYPNYRGSTGRGVEFALTSQGRPAAEEFSDIVDGVDELINRGWVDPERVGITGGSYGGYASAWAATYYSERFAAAVMNVGLSDKIAMLGTSDIPEELYLVHYLTWPWEDWDMYRKASPIYYVTQAQTPILILHGDADPRVDPTQSKILYRYLVLQENPPPVRLILYRGEGHGNQRAASRWDYSLRLMRWMDHYLKGPGGDKPPHQLDYRFDSDAWPAHAH
jgi:dipeptidyl aminopeptidase/acylaminoacyl peptidase